MDERSPGKEAPAQIGAPAGVAMAFASGLDRRIGAAIAALAALLYSASLSNGFVWDDVHLIVRPGWLERFGLLSAFTDNTWFSIARESFYRPVVFLSHRLDLALWGRDPAGHHLTNVLLYCLVTLTLARLAAALGLDRRSTIAALLLFVLHPSHAEVVAWVSGRHDLLATALGIPAVLLMLRPPPGATSGAPDPHSNPSSHGGHPLGRTREAVPWRLVAASALLLAAMLSKESALALPLALIAARAPVRRARGRPGGELAGAIDAPLGAPCWRDLVAWSLAALLVYGVLRYNCAGLKREYPYGRPSSFADWTVALAVDAKLLGRYAGMLLLGRGYGPMADSQMGAEHWWLQGASVGDRLGTIATGPELALALVALAGLVPWMARRALDSRLDRFALALLVLPLLASLNWTTSYWGVRFSDRYLFTPTLGLALLLGPRLARGALVLARRPRVMAAGALCAALAALTWIVEAQERAAWWHDRLSFAKAAALHCPLSPLAWSDLGIALQNEGDLAGAAAALRISWAIHPDPMALEALADVALARGRFGEALAAAASDGAPEPNAYTHCLLARAAARLGREAECRAHLAAARALAPEDAGVFNVMGLCLLRLGRPREAIDALARQVRLDPESLAARLDLAQSLEDSGLHDRALAALRDARARGVWTPAMDLVEARALEALAAWPDAVAAWERVACGASSLRAALRRDALRHEARCLQQDGRPRDAADLLNAPAAQ